MQTFLPYEGYLESATILDKKRCWKQVVEAAQILDALEGRSIGWANHPAVKMWVGFTNEIKVYFDTFLRVSKVKHGINTKYEYFKAESDGNKPWWLGNENFHRGMRARLIEKDRDFYLPKFPDDEGFNDAKYFWPVMESQTFRAI